LIPDLADGVLPEGIHHCTLDEVENVFGQFRGSDKRPRLTERLKRYVEAVRATGIAKAVIIDGSYITAKSGPSDIDLILVLRADFDLRQELRPFEYNVQSKRMVKRIYGFDVFPSVDGSEAYQKQVEFFSGVRLDDPAFQTSRRRKGLLRVEL
jgi:hypothetical protein